MSTLSEQKYKKKQPSLGLLLLRVVFSIYLIVTVVITSAQMYSDYKLEKEAVQSNLASYQTIYGTSVATALWNLDTDQLVATLDGASELTDITGILLYDSDLTTVYHQGNAPKSAQDLDNLRQDQQALFYVDFRIEFADKHIGTLYLFSSDNVVFDKVKYNFLFIIVNALIKTAALWILFLWAFRRYLNRALDQFIAKMKATRFNSRDEIGSIEIDEASLKSRELSFLNQVFDSLKRRLQQNQRDLEASNTQLEKTVNERTERLRRQSALLEAMGAQAQVGAWEYDLISDQTYWSDTTKTIFEVDNDFTPNERKTLSFFDEPEVEKLTIARNEAEKNGTPWNLELVLTTAKGHQRWVTSTGEAEFQDGQCVRLFGSIQDIDQRVRASQELLKAKEKAEQADELKTGFLSSLSHEIRTPMNGIIGMLNVLIDNNLNESQLEQAKVSLNSAESLLTLLNDMIDISRIESGKFTLSPMNFDLRELFSSQVSLWRNKAEEKGLQLELQVNELAIQYAYADPHRIRQIISNLINNAIKFSSSGTITLRGSTQIHRQRAELIITVSDQGIGIDEAKQAVIFQAFTRGDFKLTGDLGGAGLGLNIVKELAELMDGNVELESQPGEGSSFTVRLMIGVADATSEEELETLTQITSAASAPPSLDAISAQPTGDANSPSESHQKAAKKALIVEDNPVNQMVASALLEQQGWSSELAQDGIDALRILSENQDQSRFQLILMDCLMPNMDGYETTENIRSGQAGDYCRGIPIIAMTANAMKGDKEKCIKAGMDDYLAKPVTPESLGEMLQKWGHPSDHKA